MASTYSDRLRIELIGTGEQSGTWGNTTNTNLGTLIEEAIAGVVTISMSDANYTLTTANGATDESRQAVLQMTGSLSTTRDVICPAEEKIYIIKNGTTGGQSIVLKTSGGTGVTIPNGKTMLVYCDGTNVVTGNDALTSIAVAGSATVTGTLTVDGATSLDDSVVINESGADKDFRVEGDTDANLLFTDASTDGVGIGTNTPSQKLDVNGNVAITGTGRRITGDFSNATIANRLLFQNSTTNASTVLGAIPNGTGTSAALQLWNNPDPTNASGLDIRIAGTTDARLTANINGSGTYLPMTFFTGGSERVRIDTSGNVGIGTSSPGAKLHSYSSTSFTQLLVEYGGAGAAGINFKNSGSSNGYIYYDNGAAMTFQTSGSEKMRIDSSGNVGIGTSSPNNRLAVHGPTPFIRVNDTTSTNDLYIGSDSSGAVFNVTSANAIRFHTTNTERARIDANGRLLVGTSSNVAGIASFVGPNGAGVLAVRNSASSAGKYWLTGPDGSSNAYTIYNQGSTGVYLIDGATAWSANSDERLKTDIKPIENAAQKVSGLRAVTGRYKTDEEGTSRAFLIAQDVQKVLPEAVNVQNDEQQTLGLSYTDVVPLLVAAIKEQQSIIEDLKARVAQLENA